jgi:hypothetical protein
MRLYISVKAALYIVESIIAANGLILVSWSGTIAVKTTKTGKQIEKQDGFSPAS